MSPSYKLPPNLMAGVAIAAGGNGYADYGDTWIAQGCIGLAIIVATVLFVMINMSK